MSFASLLRGASPFGPIFGKELRVTARRKRSYYLRVGYLAVLLLVMLAVYANTMDRSYGAGAATRSQQASLLGAAFFACFTFFAIWTMGVIGPVLTSTAIGSERLHKTLPVLLMTPMSAWQIVSGKLFSRLLIALTLLGLSLPVLALVRLLGGVELGQMFAVIVVAAATATGTASIGLFISTLINRASSVILLAFGVQLLLYAFVPFVVAMWVSSRPGPPRMAVFEFLAVINPYVFAIFSISGGPFRSGGMGLLWVWCAAIQFVVAFLLLLASAAIVRRASRQAEQSAGVAPTGYTPRQAKKKNAIVPAEPAGDGFHPDPAETGAATVRRHDRNEAKSPEVSDYPILWREVRRPLMPQRWQRMTGAILCIGLLLFSYAMFWYNNALGEYDVQEIYATIANFLAWLATGIFSATAIAQEKESDTWTLLLTTPISGQAIVWGKALGVMRRLMWPALLMVAHFLIFTVTGVITWATWVLILWVILTFNTVWVATGVYLSLRLSKVAAAVIVNLLLAMIAYLGVFTLLATISGFMEVRNLGPNVGWYLPYYYINIGIESLSRWQRHPWGNHGISAPAGGSMSFDAFFLLVLLMGVVHLLAAAIVLWFTAANFDRYVGRAQQRRKLTSAELTYPSRLRAAGAA